MGAIVYKSAIVGAAHVPGVTHATVAFAWKAGSPYAAEKLDVTDLNGTPAAWMPVSAFWPAKVASVDGATTALDGDITGYEHPATAPADGLTVTVG